MTICAWCKQAAGLKCAGCGMAYYCGKHHQRADWQRHKAQCSAVRVESSAAMGRFLVANRHIRAGSVIVRKAPLVAGPKMATAPVCLGCHRRLSDDCVRCSKCQWHLCRAECERSPWHQPECGVLAEARLSPATAAIDVKSVHYALILPLRALLLRKTNPKRFDALMELEAHAERNMATPVYAYLSKRLLPLLRRLDVQVAGVDPLRICAIFDTNAFEVRNAHVDVRAIYPLISFIAHSCEPNTRHACDDGYEMSVIATRDIVAGEMITTTYTQLLWATTRRRAHLRRTKHFECACRRCADPTELRTYVGSMRCQRCADGLLVSAQPLDAEAGWACNRCDDAVSAHQVHTIDEQVHAEILAAERTPTSFEQLLRSYAHLLHDNNTHMLEVKYALLQLYESEPEGALTAHSPRILELCHDLLSVARLLEPGDGSFNTTLENSKRNAEARLKGASIAEEHN